MRQKESQERNIPRASQRKHMKWEWSTSSDAVAKWLLSEAEGWGADSLSGYQSVTVDHVKSKCGGGVLGAMDSRKKGRAVKTTRIKHHCEGFVWGEKMEWKSFGKTDKISDFLG